MATVWRLATRTWFRGWLSPLAGPLCVVAVIGTWAGLLVAGWAAIYWPHLPQGFVYSTGLQPTERTSLLDAVYLSLVAMSTLGLGDIVPTQGWLRIAVPLQALAGFDLLTAAVTWVLQVYPALMRRRVLAVQLTLLNRVGAGGAVLANDSAGTSQLLHSLATGLMQVRVDLTQYAETYYFTERDSAAALGYAAELAANVRASGHRELRLVAESLKAAVDDLAHVLDNDFLHTGGSTADVIAAFAVDHNKVPAIKAGESA